MIIMEYHSNGLDSSLLLTSFNISDATNQQLTTNTGSVVKLKIMSLNCCSLRSQAKRARLAGLTIEHQPDIILGCESHLDDSFASPEVFPDIIRKDRSIGGGGVFLAVSNKINFLCVKNPCWTLMLSWSGLGYNSQEDLNCICALIIDHPIRGHNP